MWYAWAKWPRNSSQAYTLTAQKCSHYHGVMSTSNNNIIIRHEAIMFAKLSFWAVSKNSFNMLLRIQLMAGSKFNQKLKNQHNKTTHKWKNGQIASTEDTSYKLYQLIISSWELPALGAMLAQYSSFVIMTSSNTVTIFTACNSHSSIPWP